MSEIVLETAGIKIFVSLIGVSIFTLATSLLISGYFVPFQFATSTALTTKCTDEKYATRPFHDEWCIPSLDILPPLLEKSFVDENNTNNVFAFKIPLPKGGKGQYFSVWMQKIIIMSYLDVSLETSNSSNEAIEYGVKYDAKLGYESKDDPNNDWTLMAKSIEEQKLKCDFNENIKGYPDCTQFPLLELQSVEHDTYLINIQIQNITKVDSTTQLGTVNDMWIVVIYEKENFSKIFWSLKSIFFPIIFYVDVWFWWRIKKLLRKPLLLEKLLFALGIALCILDLPLEFLVFVVDIPYLSIINASRQLLFNVILLMFLLIFCGEHLGNGGERNNLKYYWLPIAAVISTCTTSFVFQVTERVFKIYDPFFPNYSTEVDLTIAVFISVAVCAVFYLVYLCYKTYWVFFNIKLKKAIIPSMSSTLTLSYEKTMSRVKYLLIANIVCAVSLIMYFIIVQINDNFWKWGLFYITLNLGPPFIGIYSLWNVFTITYLVLYTPSLKFSHILEDPDCRHTPAHTHCRTMQPYDSLESTTSSYQ